MVLTAKQERFCQEYVVDFNATQAAIRAGYSAKTAGAIGAENLRKPQIAARIAELMRPKTEAAAFTRELVLQELGRQLKADPRKLFTEGGSLKSIHEIDDDNASAISSIEVRTERGEEGDEPAVITKIRRFDKLKAIDLAGRHFGLFPSKVEHTGANGEPLPGQAAIDPLEVARQIGFALAAAAQKIAGRQPASPIPVIEAQPVKAKT